MSIRTYHIHYVVVVSPSMLYVMSYLNGELSALAYMD